MPASCKTQTGYKKRDLKGTRANRNSAAENGVCLGKGCCVVGGAVVFRGGAVVLWDGLEATPGGRGSFA